MWKCIFLFVCGITISLEIRGNEQNLNLNYYFKQVSIEQGLSQSTVNCILCDSRGIMWIGTATGLNTLDKHELKSYYHKRDDKYSLPGNSINFIAEDSLNNIWVSTNKGLARYDRDKDCFIPAMEKGVLHTYSACLTDGGILFGGERAIYKYTYKEREVIKLPLIMGGSGYYTEFNKLIPLDNNTFLIASKYGGLWIYGTDDHILKSNIINPAIEINTAAYVDSKGRLYISPYKKGLYCLDHRGNELYHFTTRNSDLKNDIVLDILEKDGKLWLATDGGGINILDMEDLTFSSIQHVPGDNGSLPVNSINCLYMDAGKNVWAGSIRGGVFGIKKVDIRTYKDVPLNNPSGLSEKVVISLFEDENGILWIGTDGGGVNCYDPYKNTFKHFASTYGEKVVSITDIDKDNLLVSFFSNGIYIFDKKTGKSRPFTIVDQETNREECTSGFSALAYRVSKDEICLLARNIYIYHITKKSFSPVWTNEGREYLRAQRLICANDSVTYLTRENRIFKIQHGDNYLHPVCSIDVQGNTINAICYDENGKFWIASDDGLSYYDLSTKESRRVETNLFNSISALSIDKQGRLWVGAQNMLFSYIINENRFVVWGESDGFLPNELYFMPSVFSCTDNIYMGGTAGFVKINKNISYSDYSQPQIKLMEVLLNGTSCMEQSVQEDNSLEVPWNYSSLVVKVASSEKDVFRKALFRYGITGLNNQYVESYNRSFTLPVLAPGTYSIMCSCNTKSGEWTLPVRVLTLTVAPPWYQTTWFVIGSLLFMTFIVGVVMFLIIQRNENRLKWKLQEHDQRVYEEKIRFLINISHELRTPLTLIYAPLKRLLEYTGEWEQGKIKEQLKGVCKQAWQMKNIINMVLDLDKMNSDQAVLQTASLPFNEWVRAVAENFRYEYENKQIDIVYQLDRQIRKVVFDANKCEIVLSNLLMNALKYSPSETQVTISTRLNGKNVRVAVADQGMGLEHLELDKLFTRFYQGKHGTIGSGIGLSYARTLIEMHGGTIEAMPNGEKGAVFYFELPLVVEDKKIVTLEQVPLEINSSLPGEDIEPAAFSTEIYSVLVVEDEKELRFFLKDALKEYFKHVFIAEDGIEALQKIKEIQPDIIISDVMMPRMDGFQLCRKIKGNIEISHIPVILLTAMGDSQSVARGYKLGADIYVAKPFDIELLLTIIRNLLKNRENIKVKYKNTTQILSPQESTISNADEKFLLKLNQLIADNLSNPDLNVNFLTEKVVMSRASLYNKVKILTGIGVNDYINKFRIERAVTLLSETDLSITEISEQVGFAYQRYFSSVFKQMKGCLPSKFRQELPGKHTGNKEV